MNEQKHPRYLREREAAERIGASVQTMRNWRFRGEGPPFFKPRPRMVRYREDDLEKFMQGREQ